MNKCLTVHVPSGAEQRAAPGAQNRAGVRLAFSPAAQSISRLSLGTFLAGLSGTTESTPLNLTLFRVLSAVVQRFRASPKHPAGDRLLLVRGDSYSREVARASDPRSALVTTEPGPDRRRRSLRGAWAQSESDHRFERRRLMRMTHQTPNEDSHQNQKHMTLFIPDSGGFIKPWTRFITFQETLGAS
jgi:hypothetical protein